MSSNSASHLATQKSIKAYVDGQTHEATLTTEQAQDIAGALVASGGTKTGITVTYQDSTNDMDFVIGTLNQDTTGTAAIATSVAVEDTTDTSCYVGLFDDASGNLGAKSDAGLTYNAGTGRLTATGLSGDGSGITALNGTNVSSGTVAAARVATLNQNTTGSSATCTGLAGSATVLASARTIGGVSFDGSANINLPGVNAAGNQSTSSTSAGLTGTPAITVGAITAASAVISGDLTVNGQTTTISTTNLEVEDKLILLADGGSNADAASGGGIQLQVSGDVNDYPEIKWAKDKGAGNTDGTGEAVGLTGWTVRNMHTSNPVAMAIAVMDFKTDTGAPSNNSGGIGSLLWNSEDDALYVRSA